MHSLAVAIVVGLEWLPGWNFANNRDGTCKFWSEKPPDFKEYYYGTDKAQGANLLMNKTKCLSKYVLWELKYVPRGVKSEKIEIFLNRLKKLSHF